MTIAATEVQARAFCAEMLAHFKGVLVPQAALSGFLSATIGIDPTKFINAHAVGLGPLVWVHADLSPDQLIETVTAECQRLVQWWARPVDVTWLYVTSGEARARIETQCHVAAAELDYARWGVLPTLEELVDSLRTGYLLSAEDLALARDLFESAMTTAVTVWPSTESARKAVAFLKATYPELLT